jgi:hypothetical protein
MNGAGGRETNKKRQSQNLPTPRPDVWATQFALRVMVRATRKWFCLLGDSAHV